MFHSFLFFTGKLKLDIDVAQQATSSFGDIDVIPSPKLRVTKMLRTYGIPKIEKKCASEDTDSNNSEVLQLLASSSQSLRTPSPLKHRSDTASSSASFVTKIIDMPSPTESMTPRKKKMRKRIGELKRSLKKKSAIASRLQQKALSFSTRNVLANLLQNKSPSVKALVYMQCFHRKRGMWTKGEKQLALSLYYKSPGNYKFLLRNLGFVLPGVTTIQSWLRVFNLRTGINTTLITKLKLKVRNMSEEERECVLMFDEITLKKGLCHNAVDDVIEGYEDFGNLGRTSKLGSHALLFFIRGLLHNWKLPFSYYVSCGPTKGNIITELVKEVVGKLQSIGLIVRVIVCDQGANNRKALANLEASKEDPFILLNGKRILTIFDTPHLLKSLRNNFMNDKLKIYVRGRRICWSDITQAYAIDRSSFTTRAMLKITDKHLHPTTFQKMRVKFAAQVFSNSVFAAILTCFATGQLKSETAMDTATFIRNINNIFDCLNSRILRDCNPYRCALSVYKLLPQKTLEEALDLFKTIEIFEGDKLRSNIYCIDGFIWTIQGILQLWTELQNEGKKFLLTSRLHQDPIENAFSVIRTRGGYNPQPTVRLFRIALQHNMHIRLQTPVAANCEMDEDETLLLEDEDDKGNEKSEAEESTSELCVEPLLEESLEEVNEEVPSLEGQASVSQMSSQPTLETCTTVYLAGYLCYSLFKKSDCMNCRDELLTSTESLLSTSEFFIMNRDYGVKESIQYLARPSASMCDVITFLLQTFNECFNTFKHEYNVKSKIKAGLLSAVESSFSDWFNKCRQHKLFIIELLIKVKLYRSLRWEIEDTEKKTVSKYGKPHRKVTILS